MGEKDNRINIDDKDIIVTANDFVDENNTLNQEILVLFEEFKKS